MFELDGSLVFSATDLTGFVACGHLPLLEREAALGLRERPADRASLAARYGDAHEAAYLEALKAGGRRVAELARPPLTSSGLRTATEESRAALAEGYDVVYQATFFDGGWLGHPDFLFRVDRPDAPLGHAYDVVDTKLARHVKATALLQVALYGELLTPLQGCPPAELILALGNGAQERFAYREAAAYLRSVRARFLRALGEEAPYPVPVEHCDLCSWAARCEQRRRDDDHLSLVADIRRQQIDRLEEVGVTTLRALAGAPPPPATRVGGRTLARLHRQAAAQLESAERGVTSVTLLPRAPGDALDSLPAPDAGDLFFDMEGFPYADEGGLEYLFGWVDAQGAFHALFAEDRVQEREAFERLMDEIARRRGEHPGMHVYHYAAYERSALSRLSNRHGVREEEVADLLRDGVLVDLYRVARNGVVVGAESYSIKSLEPLYGIVRNESVRNAAESLEMYQEWLDSEPRDALLLERIADYNAVDCRSTLALRDWLLALARSNPFEVVRGEEGEEAGERRPSASFAAWLAAAEDAAGALRAGVPEEPPLRSPEQQAASLLGHLLKFHQREDNAAWRDFFARLELTSEELRDDGAAVGELRYEGPGEAVRRSQDHRYSFPAQDVGLRLGDRPVDPATGAAAGELVALEGTSPTEPGRGQLTLRRGANADLPHPEALVPLGVVNNAVLREALIRLARALAASGFAHPAPAQRAACQLLLGEAPRLRGEPAGTALARPGERGAEALRRVAPLLEGGALAVQGPPGSGKTYTSAKVILDAVAQRKRVGVTANSHRVIENLLTAVTAQAARDGVAVRVARRIDDGRELAGIVNLSSTAAAGALLDAGEVDVIGGTAWLMAHPDMADRLDLLVVDEAGQFSLANTLASMSASRDVLLVGDPAQLDQPIQAAHPEGSEISALAHMIGGEATMDPRRGLFLEHTRRMHPAITAFISEVAYDQKLVGIEGLERQLVTARHPVPGLPPEERLAGAGLRFLAVSHHGNRTSSSEEAERVALAVEELIGGTFTDARGDERLLDAEDLLVVTPYNAQIAVLRARLPEGVEVGTVDRFQGREAPVVLYSMATSSIEDLPRDFEFLFSLNRLNVAVSRAQALAVLVCSPTLLAPRCRTPRQILLVNALCRLVERARES